MFHLPLSWTRGRWPCLAPFIVAVALAVAIRPARGADEIHWTFLGPTSVAFDWRGSETTIHFGRSTYTDSVTAHAPVPVPVSSPGPYRQAVLTGLDPGTEYHYAIGGGADHTFHTAPARGAGGFTLDVFGDVGTSTYAPMPQVQALVAQRHPSFCLVVGDLSYADELGPAAVNQHFDDVMVWSTDIAYMPAWGNHEWETARYGDTLANYKGRFRLPNPRSSPGSPSCCGADWYWFDYGNLRFIAYPEPWPGALEDWLPRAWAIMDSAEADPTVAAVVTFGHRPAYSSGDHPGSAKFRSSLDSLGAAHPKYRLDLSGHDHDYQRTVPVAGVTHVVAGIGGAGLMNTDTTACGWAICPAPSWIATRAIHHGLLELTVYDDRIEGTAVCGPAVAADDIQCSPGDAFDRFTIPIGQGAALAAGMRPRFVPSPAQPAGRIEFTTPSAGPLRVTLFDPQGRRVRQLIDDPAAPAGAHDYPLAGAKGLPAGVYLYRIESGGRAITGRMVLLD